MQTTIMDCIQRVPGLAERAVRENPTDSNGFFDRHRDALSRIDEIILVGSGTSFTSSMTAAPVMEKVGGLRVTVMLPDAVLRSSRLLLEFACYLFVSQTGTSKLTQRALQVLQARGLLCAAVSESGDTPMAKMTEDWIDIHCGTEEYPMRTIGYSMTVFTLIQFAMQMGLHRKTLAAEDFERYGGEALAAANALRRLIPQADEWILQNRRAMLRSDCIALTGAGDLYGVALEGAVKLWEMPQIPAMGYELDEVMHGPNFGFSGRHCLIVLDDGVNRSDEARAICKYMKNEMQNGFLVGPASLDAADFGIREAGNTFRSLLYAGVVQVISYELALNQGRNLLVRDKHEVMYSYFNSHFA